MRIHFNLAKANAFMGIIEREMQTLGLHVHGVSGTELGNLWRHATQEGQTIASAVKALGLEAKTAASAPEVPEV